MEQTKYALAKKPAHTLSMRGQKSVDLLCNYIRLGLNPNENIVKQYSIKFEPEIARDNAPKKREILRRLTHEIKAELYPSMQSGDTIFSPKTIDKDIVLTHHYDGDGEEYKVTIAKTDNIIDLTQITEINTYSFQIKNFLENLVKNIISSNNGLVRFNKRSIFDYNNVTKMEGNNNS